MAAVINCSPVKVVRVGRYVLTQLADDESAKNLEQALKDAHDALNHPEVLRRRYAAIHGLSDGLTPTD